jgi:hypothetical protein
LGTALKTFYLPEQIDWGSEAAIGGASSGPTRLLEENQTLESVRLAT